MKALTYGLLFWAVSACSSLWIATQQPWLGLGLKTTGRDAGLRVSRVFPDGPLAGRMHVGEVVTHIRGADGHRVALRATDIISAPTYLATYADIDEFFDRQQVIAQILRSGRVWLARSDGTELEAVPGPVRPLGALPTAALFEFTLMPGLAILIAFSVLHRRPADPAVRYVVASAVGYVLLVTGAMYGKRELALPAELFRVLLALNNGGGLIFMGGSTVALMWHLPTPLTRRPAAPWIYLVATLGAVTHVFQLVDTPTLGFWFWCLLCVAAHAVIAALQWRRARGQPARRAVLKWLLVPWFSIGALYSVLFYIPASFGLGAKAPAVLGWLLFLLLFVGIAFSMSRFRLYYLNPANLLVWFLDGLLIVMLACTALYLLKLPYFLAGCIALGIAGLLHPVLRHAVWSYRTLRETDFSRVLKRVLDVLGSCRSSAQVHLSWAQTLSTLYAPHRLAAERAPVAEVCIADDGETMRIPPLRAGPGLALALPSGGRRLFMPLDVRAVADLHRMFGAVIDYWESYQAGAGDERLRLARALDSGLLESIDALIGLAPNQEARRFAMEAQTELERISGALAEPARDLGRALEALREQTVARCEAAGIRCHWQENALPESASLPGQVIFDLQSIVREAVTNAIRHSGGSLVKVDLGWGNADSLKVAVEDDGLGRPDALVSGRGIGNMRRRASVRGGRLELQDAGSGGLRVAVSLPLH